MTQRPVQYFSQEQIERGKDLTPEQIVHFLEDYRTLFAPGQSSKSKLISIKIPENLLNAFKTKAKLQNRPYQTIIKELMRAWL